MFRLQETKPRRPDRIEKMIEQSQRASKEANARRDREIAENRCERRWVNELVRRFIKLGVKEARDHRGKRREFDEKMTQLASAQMLTEEKMKELAASQGRD